MKDYTQYMKNLPVMPDIATKILNITEEKLDISFKELENTIKMDPGLSAKILRVANSALYARQREVKNLQMAITLLGFKTIKSLILLITASGMFTRGQNTGFYKFFWKHSVITAFIAKDIKEAYKQAKKVYDRGWLIVISGSFFLVGEAKKLISAEKAH